MAHDEGNGAVPPEQGYRKIVAWQRAHEVAKGVILLSRSLGASEPGRVIRRQLLRAATSVPANIAEGYAGSQGARFRNHLSVARGSAVETDYWLLLAAEVELLSQEDYRRAASLNAETIRILTAMIRRMDERA